MSQCVSCLSFSTSVLLKPFLSHSVCNSQVPCALHSLLAGYYRSLAVKHWGRQANWQQQSCVRCVPAPLSLWRGGLCGNVSFAGNTVSMKAMGPSRDQVGLHLDLRCKCHQEVVDGDDG